MDSPITISAIPWVLAKIPAINNKKKRIFEREHMPKHRQEASFF